MPLSIPIMTHKKHNLLLYKAWIKLMAAFAVSFAISLIAGILLIKLLNVDPEKIFEISTKRIAVASALFDKGLTLGIDKGILIFAWNSLGSLVTISFVYTAALLNPHEASTFPRGLRKMLCGEKRMKLLCYLPGCLRIEEESLRRLYVWLAIPLLAIILLGVECGLIVSTAASITGSYFIGIVALLPHGIIEIPSITLAGAVAFSAHILMKEDAHTELTSAVFEKISIYRSGMPIRIIALSVTFCLLAAGLIEAHLTERIVEGLLN